MKHSIKLILLNLITLSIILALSPSKISTDSQNTAPGAKNRSIQLKRKLFKSEDHGAKVNILNRRLLVESSSETKPATDNPTTDTSKSGNNDNKANNNDDGDEDEETPAKPVYCNNELLYSYGVFNSGLREENSKLCGDTDKKTCCSPTSEQIILNFWKNNNRAKIKMYIEGYVHLLKAILNFYPDYIKKADKIRAFPSAPPECHTAAEKLIEKFVPSDQISLFMPQLEKAYQHIGFARKSFYCVLCSTDAQPYFDTINKNIIFAKRFCENLVQSTIQEFYTRSVEYMDLLNQMNAIADCDPNIPYNPDVYTINFKLEEAAEAVVSKCHTSYVKDNDPRVFFEECSDYCSTFSISHARETIEGNFGKLYFLYQKLLALGELPSTLLFDEVDYSVKYDFSYVSTEFYESNLKSFELDAFTSTFDRNGIELFYIAANSDLGYNKNSGVGAIRMGVVGLIAAVFWVISN